MPAFIVLTRILPQYLRSHERLVVPQLGLFLVKESDRTVLFSELVRRDDGVLRALLVETGMNELTAAGEIDRFVFEVRHAVEGGGEYAVPGLGVLRPGPNGTVAFEYRPLPAEELPSAPAAAPRPQAERRTVAAPHPAPKRAAVEQPDGDGPHLSVSARMQPEKCVEGLNYGRPIRNTKSFTYVDRPVRRRVDRFVAAAVVALLIALGAIAYGYYHDLQERRAADRMIERIEQAIAPDEAPTAEE